jgi:hypothetical protein
LYGDCRVERCTACHCRPESATAARLRRGRAARGGVVDPPPARPALAGAPRLLPAFLAVAFFAARFLVAMGYFAPPRAAGTAGAAAAGVAFLSAAFAPVCPRNNRVGANSPSLCPTMFSVR